MISTFRKTLWLGYSQAGGTANVRFDELNGRLLLLGERANEMAALFAYASSEAGFRPVILDMDGELSSLISGYFDGYEISDILYDLYRLDEDERRHGQLVAAAYTSALDLTTEEEAILLASIQNIAVQDNLVSPPVVYDALTRVEGFRGFYVEKLQGRIGTLKSLDAADSCSVGEVLASKRGVIVNVSTSTHPHAAELAGALFIAKLIAVIRAQPSPPAADGEEKAPVFLLVNDAHHIFHELPRLQHSTRLLTSLLEAPITTVFASDLSHTLVSQLVDACHVKIHSSNSWNQMAERERKPTVLPNFFVLQDDFYGTAQPFVARRFDVRISAQTMGDTKNRLPEGAAPPKTEGREDESDRELTKRVLESILAFKNATRVSLIAYLSVEFPKARVEEKIDRLHRTGDIIFVPKQEKSGKMILALSLTRQGEESLRGLSG